MRRRLLFSIGVAWLLAACAQGASGSPDRAASPWIAAVTPRYGGAGAELTLRGTFGPQAGTVTVGGRAASVIQWKADEIRLEVPAGVAPGRAAVEVETAGATSNRMPFFQRGRGVWVPQLRVSPDAAPVWTGREVLFFVGGDDPVATASGGAVVRYHPDADAWSAGSSVGAPLWRADARTFWTGDELVVLGGDDDAGAPAAGGAAYAPLTDSWRPLRAPNGPDLTHDAEATAVWCYGRYLVFAWSHPGKVRRYDPAEDEWREGSVEGAPTISRRSLVTCADHRVVVWQKPQLNASFSDALGVDAAGIYDVDADAWSSMSTDGAPYSAADLRSVWSGRDVLVWGAEGGAKYDLAAGRWAPIASSGAPATTAVGVFHAGREMLVLTGAKRLAAYSYAPETNTWRQAPPSSVEFSGDGARATWADGAVFMFDTAGGSGECCDGVAFDVAAEAWRPFGMTVPRSGVWPPRRTVWTGSALLALDGGTVWQYVPATDAWQMLTLDPSWATYSGASCLVWTGKEALAWGGAGGVRIDPATGDYAALTTAGSGGVPLAPACVWTGTELVAWGGSSRGGNLLASGGRFNPATNAWRPVTTGANAPPAREGHTAVWTGSRMLVWGGFISGGATNTGASYDPVNDAWAAIPTVSAPAARGGHAAVWIGDGMFIWGGVDAWSDPVTTYGDGAVYRPASGTWGAVNMAGAPAARPSPEVVWTGKEVFVWGGAPGYGKRMFDGASYDPAADRWSAMPFGVLPEAAPTDKDYLDFGAQWTGSEILSLEGIYFTQ